MRSNQVPDNRNFVPSPLSDQTIEKAQADVAKKETSVDNFLAGMILSRAERQNALARWARGGRDASTTPEQVSRAFARSYAQHVEIADDALPLIRAGTPRRSFPEYDQVCDAICSAVVERLSGFLSSYKFKNDEAIEKLEIPELGTITVTINRSEAGIFHEIREIRADSFRIYNSRSSGRSYKAEFCELGFPHEIGVVPLGIEKLTLYDDRSGIHLTRNGLEYTNSRSYTGNGGYDSDCFRDQLRPMLRCFHETKDPEILARLKIIESEQVERGEIKPYQSVTVPYEDEAAYQKFMDKLGRPLELSFKAVTDEIVQWLQTNVLEKILATPTAQNQRMLPELPPQFPESVGPIYTWMKQSDQAKLVATNRNLSCVDPDERWAIKTGWRLASLGVRGDFPEAAYDGYIWC